MLLMQKAASRQAIANKGFMVSTLNNPKIAYCRQRGSAVCEEVIPDNSKNAMEIFELNFLNELIKLKWSNDEFKIEQSPTVDSLPTQNESTIVKFGKLRQQFVTNIGHCGGIV